MEQEFKTADKVLKIEQDCYGESPRSWDNLARVILASHTHIGDNHDIQFSGEYNSREDFIETGEQEVRKQLKDVVICKPLHYYEHSGCGVSTSMGYPFNCRWDSGTIGFVVITKEDIRKNWGIKRVTQKYIDHADEILEGEIETLNQYLSGDVYSFTIEDLDGNHIDSCSGFYGGDHKTNGITDHIADEELCRLLEEF
jgi:hypothetical protein